MEAKARSASKAALNRTRSRFTSLTTGVSSTGSPSPEIAAKFEKGKLKSKSAAEWVTEGARQESKNLLIAASYYIQPIGTFSGYVRAHEAGPKREVQGLLGVTEDHRSKW